MIKIILTLLIYCLSLQAGVNCSVLSRVCCPEEAHPHTIAPQDGSSLITTLPKETLGRIFYFLDIESMKQFRLVCKDTYNAFDIGGENNRNPRESFYHYIKIASGEKRPLSQHPYPEHVRALYPDRITTTDETLAETSNLFPSLNTFSLAHCTQLTTAAILPLLTSFSVRELDLTWCTGIGDEGILTLSKCPTLEKLTLNCCRHYKDETIASLNATPSLHTLSLKWCSQLTNAAIGPLSKSTSLHTLNLQNCELITDPAISFLAKSPHLRNLTIQSCSLLTDASIHALIKGEAPLQFLDYTWCFRITNDSINQLKQIKPNLNIQKW